MRSCFFIFFSLVFCVGSAQTIGGSAAYNFLHLPASVLISGAGGVNISYKTDEVGIASNNPALLGPQLHSHLHASFNGFLGGIKAYSSTASLYKEKWQTSFGGHIYFLDYGSIPQTDAAGNTSGTFRPVDFVVQIGAGRKYLERWNYGVNLKLIHSKYQQYTSSAIALDAGVLYEDSANSFTASVLAKNMGFQLKTYAGQTEDLPFDLQVGVTKRLSKAPFGFSLTAQHAHQFDIHYNDTTYNSENGLDQNAGFFYRLLNHFVVASHVYMGKNLEATFGYNHLRRSELNMGSTSNGLNGFSLGIRVKFQKIQVLYARSNYQSNIAYNQIGITLRLKQAFE